jgi:2-phospho-L-lactate guanylyltransferase
MKGDVPWAVLPVKALARAKRRLAGALPPEALRTLVLELYMTTLNALIEVVSEERVVVVSDGACVLDLAEDHGARAVRQSGDGLNAAVSEGESRVTQLGARSVLVILSDLPLLEAPNVRNFLACLPEGRRAAAVAPSQRGGTSALLLRPPGIIRYSFGSRSFVKHVEEIMRAGIYLAIHQSRTFFFDLDTPVDLSFALGARPQLLRRVDLDGDGQSLSIPPRSTTVVGDR